MPLRYGDFQEVIVRHFECDQVDDTGDSASKLYNAYLQGEFDGMDEREIEETILSMIHGLRTRAGCAIPGEIAAGADDEAQILTRSLREKILEETKQIRDAIESRRFFVLYQPIFTFPPAARQGEERWQSQGEEPWHPVMVEALGRLADDVDMSAFRMCTFLHRKQRLGEYTQIILPQALDALQNSRNGASLSVNITEQDLLFTMDGKDFADLVCEAVQMRGLLPRKVVFELLEWSERITQDPKCAQMMRKLQRNKHRLAIDDVGSDADFKKIEELLRQGVPMDIVKIDRQVLQDYIVSGDESFFRRIMEIGHVMEFLGTETMIIAQGIEDRASFFQILDLHRKFREEGLPGFHGFQGYYLQKPGPHFLQDRHFPN